jgi:hypothetical protein
VLLALLVAAAVGAARAEALAFLPATHYSTAQWPQAIAVADVNNDGIKDLVTANLGEVGGSNTVSVLLGDGHGGFGAHADFATGADPESVAVGDFNGDGKQDIVTANFLDDTVSLLLGDGHGGFGAHADFATGTHPESVAVGDFNNDGKLDLVTANYQGGNVSVLLGNGSGGFAAHSDFALGLGALPMSVAVADLNNDGKLDLVTANSGSPTVSVLLGNGHGGFGAATDFATFESPVSVAVGDFNGDGGKDLVTADYSFNGAVSVLLGNGLGSFGAKTDVATETYPLSVAVGDLDHDGKQDLVTAGNQADTVSVLLGNGSGGFGAHADFATGAAPCAAPGTGHADSRHAELPQVGQARPAVQGVRHADPTLRCLRQDGQGEGVPLRERRVEASQELRHDQHGLGHLHQVHRHGHARQDGQVPLQGVHGRDDAVQRGRVRLKPEADGQVAPQLTQLRSQAVDELDRGPRGCALGVELRIADDQREAAAPAHLEGGARESSQLRPAKFAAG